MEPQAAGEALPQTSGGEAAAVGREFFTVGMPRGRCAGYCGWTSASLMTLVQVFCSSCMNCMVCSRGSMMG